MDANSGWLLAAAAALLLALALAAGLEAALASLGLPRAQALAREPRATRRARAAEALLGAREDTAAALGLLELCAGMGAGAVASWQAWRAFPGGLGAAAAAGAVLAAALLALALAAAARALAARHAEGVALALAVPGRLLVAALLPASRLAAALARLLARGPARFAPPLPPLEELERALAEHAQARGGPAAQSTSDLIHRVFAFREKVARDVMVPRTEVVAVDIGTPVPDLLTLLSERGHSRLPVYRGNLDRIVGTLHVRDVVPLLQHPELIVLADLVRPPCFVPWSKPIEELLREMQRRRLHMAMVVDEYGGVMGLCTLEDVLEEIVGDIGDEFDEGEPRDVESHPDGTYTVRGDAPLASFNDAAGAALPAGQGYETVAGFLNHLAGAIPAAGDRFLWHGWLFTVSEATPRRVTRVRAARVKRQAAPA
jgi:CBS domain containing-hemolysin-like protein